MCEGSQVRVGIIWISLCQQCMLFDVQIFWLVLLYCLDTVNHVVLHRVALEGCAVCRKHFHLRRVA